MLATEGSNANSYDQFRFANDDEQEIARWRAEISWRQAARHEPYAGRKGKMILEMIDERQQGSKARSLTHVAEPKQRSKEFRGSVKRKGFESDEDSPPRKTTAHRGMAVVYDNDEE
ncbi:RNA polymerase-associated protein LEO1 [Sesbania bispinosa]|nr:RNA polymerase-associated protein LEO1 [Sesbania bispinosa]